MMAFIHEMAYTCIIRSGLYTVYVGTITYTHRTRPIFYERRTIFWAPGNTPQTNIAYTQFTRVYHKLHELSLSVFGWRKRLIIEPIVIVHTQAYNLWNVRWLYCYYYRCRPNFNVFALWFFIWFSLEKFVFFFVCAKDLATALVEIDLERRPPYVIRLWSSIYNNKNKINERSRLSPRRSCY